MAVSGPETLASVRQRLESLVEIRLNGFNDTQQREYQQLVEREAILLKAQSNADAGRGRR